MSTTLKYIVSICLILPFGLNTIVLGQQANNNEVTLTPRQEAIIPISAYAAKGDQVNLKVALADGLEKGLTVNEIKEILVQLYAYAGFPRSLNAINTFQALVKASEQKSFKITDGNKPGRLNFGDDKYQFGKNVQAKLTGRSANSTQDFVPVIDTFLKEHLFADIFGRDNIDYQSREIATISIIATIGNADSQLNTHLSVGRNVGLSEKQLRGIAAKMSIVVSFEAGKSTNKYLDTIFGSNGTMAIPSFEQPVVSVPTFSQGNKVNSNNFTGDVWVSMLISDTATRTSVGNVTFAPGARSNWHIHSSGQILLITDGIGYYQEKGQPIRLIRRGDVVNCTANIAHWHGASSDSSMSHIAVGNVLGVVRWFDKVTDDEYNTRDKEYK